MNLLQNILDPVIDYYGMIKLTYGFCSAELAKKISGRISPNLDQHAAHERKRNGKFICERLGAACDFLIEDEDMWDVVTWIFENICADRVYFYGADKPIHVSWSPNPIRQITRMNICKSGKRVPQTITK